MAISRKNFTPDRGSPPLNYDRSFLLYVSIVDRSHKSGLLNLYHNVSIIPPFLSYLPVSDTCAISYPNIDGSLLSTLGFVLRENLPD